ncbi:glycosyltransferase 87 family protein [Corynebacterium sp. MSK044]|uniref:glycosyltransferase 87 family protein n=1 Tax=unclassified Corynebacterium TaxID=2624378 RepID=UPI00254A9E8D|nr:MULTISPECIES: glycosyltransferase 87 family protein [unclassified Corynebacterium]MDK8795425.1 glycosyltransferase 87 family protein [Corynebacterium sp. MSK041]MDK8798047.1 glycosyltransferase 87 family protein [Corynebacterium sp. MSK044]
METGEKRSVKQFAGQATVAGALLVALVVFVYRYWANFEEYNSVFKTDIPLDLWIYLRGGERVIAGEDLYSGFLIFDLPFTYPPFSGLLFAFLSVLDDITVTVLWHTMSILGTLLVLWLCFVRLGVKMTPVFAVILPALAAFFLLGTEPMHATLFWGQVNILLMVLVCLDFLTGKYRLPGIGVGLAAGIKLTPAFFGLLFLVQRRWVAALGSIVTFLVTVVVGWLAVPDAKAFWTDAMFSSDRVGDHSNPGAQSIKSVLVRDFGIESGAVWLVLALVTVALVAWAAWLAVQRDNLPLAVGFVGLGACLVSPFSWYHHWVWIVPLGVAILVGVNRAAARVMPAQLAGLVSCLALFLVMVPFSAVNIEPIVGQLRSSLYVYTGLALIIGYIIYAQIARIRLR